MSGLERQAKCEDPEYQRNPINNGIYYDYYDYYGYYEDGEEDHYVYSSSENEITPVNTFYPHGTVCYVDKSGGW